MSPIVLAKRAKRSADPGADLAFQITHGLGLHVEREVKFHPTRKWKFDLAIIRCWLAIEIEGGLFVKGSGRHNRGAGMRNDIEKYNEALLCDPPWRVLRVLPEWVWSGKAFGLVERAVKGRG